MQDQENDSAFDDDAYDDILDDSFEEDFSDADYGDVADLEIDELEDDSFDSEWDDISESDVLEANIGAQRNKIFNINMSFNAMAITAAIILGLAVLVFQVLTTKSTDVVERFVSALHMAGSSDGPVFGQEKEVTSTQIEPIGVMQPEDTSKGFLYNPEILNSMEMELGDTPPMPAPVTSEIQEGDPSIDQIPRAPINQPVKTSVTLQENAEFSKQEKIGKKIDSLSGAEKMLKAAIEARNNKVGTENRQKLQKGTSDIILKTEALQMKVPVTLQPEKVLVSDVVGQTDLEQVRSETPALEKKIDTILNRLDDMELRISQIREAGNSKIENVSGIVEGLKKEIEILEKAPVVKTATKSKSVKKSVKKISKPLSVKKIHKILWELRAAQPGKAWVSRQGQADMQAVTVGETLFGIGRISSVSIIGGKWVVQGTNGQIRQ